MFAFMPKSVRRGFVGLSRPRSQWQGHGDALTIGPSFHPYTILALNMLTQLICVSGVNQLSSVRTTFFFFSPFARCQEQGGRGEEEGEVSPFHTLLSHAQRYQPRAE